MNSTQLTARKNNLMASATTPTLVVTLLRIEGTFPRTADLTHARRMVIEELEARFPEVAPAMDEWSNDLDTDITYAEALIAALPAEALA
jgi:hypothetical protein